MAHQITQTQRFSVFKWLAEWLREHQRLGDLRDQVREERKHLAELDDDLLRDIGITKEQALRESSRAYDDIPARRLRFWMCCQYSVTFK
ncbi:MAG: DUF1127 domain-containing protein [Rhizobiaceae bacterium]|nr:DUF1127 domain-containing protein [Rhizobiaceae bacterium]